MHATSAAPIRNNARPNAIVNNARRQNSRMLQAQLRFETVRDPTQSCITLRGKIPGGKSLCYNEKGPRPKSKSLCSRPKGPRPRTIGHGSEAGPGGETKKANLKEKQRPFATAFGKKNKRKSVLFFGTRRY